MAGGWYSSELYSDLIIIKNNSYLGKKTLQLRDCVRAFDVP